jgi:hypothetical protein
MTAKRKAPNASCTVPTKDGDPCPAPAMRGNTVCAMHSDDPAVQMRMQVARATGMALSRLKGRHFKAGTRLETPTDWLLAICAMTNDLAAQPNTPQRVTSFTALSREAREWFVLNAAQEGRIIEGYTS